MDKDNINRAFEILYKKFDKILQKVTEDISIASKQKNFDKVKSLGNYGKRIKKFKRKIEKIQKECEKLLGRNILIKNIKSELKKGLNTPQSEYKIPILESLIELGGKAETNKVLSRVYEKMKDKFTQIDLENVLSGDIRWINMVRWTRNTMKNEGLLSKDSPRGIWEITEKGKEYYYKSKK